MDELFEEFFDSHQVPAQSVKSAGAAVPRIGLARGKITHQPGEHDDFGTAAAGVVEHVLGRRPVEPGFIKMCLELDSEELIVRRPAAF